MARNDNKPHREEMCPPFRTPSQNHYGEERSPRPARPRLNREIVDRAWQDGAQQQHADYRPRTNNRNGNSNYQSRQQEPRGFGSTQKREQQGGYRSGPGYRSGSGYRRDTDSSFEQRPPYQKHGRPAPYNQRQQRFDEQPADYQRRNGPYKDSGRHTPNNDHMYRPDQRNDSRSHRPEHTDRRWHNDGPEQSNRRWHNNSSSSDRFNRRGQQDGQEGRFEGDYERFQDRNSSFRENGHSTRDPRRHADESQTAKTERHVTRMPDGRVIKGSRPQQRKKAHFWTEIAEEREVLLDPNDIRINEND